MKIHKETIASEIQLLIDGVNSKEQAVEEIAAYIRWRDKQLTIPAVVVSEERAELCDNPNCEDGIVDRDYYGHPIYCQVCESHN